jgi:ribonuclease R
MARRPTNSTGASHPARHNSAPRTAHRQPANHSHHKPDPTPALEGIFSVHPRGFGFVAVPGTDDVFVPAPIVRGKNLYTGDVVRVRYNEERRAAYDIEALERRRDRVFGTLRLDRGTQRFIVDPWVGADSLVLRPAAVSQANLREGDGAVVLLNAERTVTSYGPASLPPALRQRALERFSRSQLGTEVPIPTALPEPPRRDLTDLVTFTIDGPSSRDLDDAISVVQEGENYRLYVHIADVATAVPLGSPADLRARALATSTYLPGYSLPMFPPALSYDECSLLEGVTRRTLTVEYVVTSSGSVTDVQVYHARIKSNARLTYDEAAAEIAGASALSGPVHDALLATHQATLHLGAARAKKGGLSESQPSPVELLVTDTHIAVSPPDTAQVAHDLIEEAMVAANEAVASWLVREGVPGIYRTHPQPGDDVVLAIEALAAAAGIKVTVGGPLTPRTLARISAELKAHPGPNLPLAEVVQAHLERATYQTTPGLHYGLASDAYVHFTSPIRRYADLTVHRSIYAHLTGGSYTEDFSALCELINDASGIAARTENACRSLFWATLLRNLPKNAKTNMSARIVKIADKGIVVALDEYGASGWILARELDYSGVTVNQHGLFLITDEGIKYSLAQSVRVRVVESDVESGLVTFALA